MIPQFGITADALPVGMPQKLLTFPCVFNALFLLEVHHHSPQLLFEAAERKLSIPAKNNSGHRFSPARISPERNTVEPYALCWIAVLVELPINELID